MKMILFSLVLFAVLLGSAAAGDLYPTWYNLPMGYDTLRNTSNLTDEEIMNYLERGCTTDLGRELDLDRDGYADGTNLPVDEFIGRIGVVLYRNREIEAARIRYELGIPEPDDLDT